MMAHDRFGSGLEGAHHEIVRFGFVFDEMRDAQFIAKTSFFI